MAFIDTKTGKQLKGLMLVGSVGAGGWTAFNVLSGYAASPGGLPRLVALGVVLLVGVLGGVVLLLLERK